jgi:Ca2+-binding RTX toxin-like protein
VRRTIALLALTFGFVLLAAAGTAFAVSKVCPGNCRGTSGDDRIVGSARMNTIYAEDGNDRVLGRAGDDALKGGDGRDEVYGQDGNDRVKGGAGMDEVHGGPGDDLVRGGTPERPNDGVRDILDCGDGTDTVYFVEGQDRVGDDCEIRNPPTT